MVRVRVRGIYATAIAKALLDKGFELSDLSAKLKSRLGYEGSPEPPHVTVKHSDEDYDELVIIGFPKETDEVIATLRETFPFSVHHLAVPNLHSAYKVTVDENCIAEVEGLKAVLKSKECYEGKEAVAEVARARVKPGDKVVLEEGFRVIGFYLELIVGRGPGVTFSRHITNPSLRSTLASLASDLTSQGFKVHWRSSARNAPLDELREEMERLVNEASKIMLAAREAPPGTMLYPGERLDVADVTFEDKLIMDEVRARVLPTMPYHHSLKSGGEKMSAAVELGDKISARTKIHEDSVLEYLHEIMNDSKQLSIIHKKVDGSAYVLGKARVVGRLDEFAILVRRAKEYGKYDGLDVVKEPGDVIVTLVKPFENHLIHSYFDEFGGLKGIYVNINTGAEVGEGTLKYLDLEVDVVMKEDEVRVIDEELMGALPAPLQELAQKELEKVMKEESRIRELVRRAAGAVFDTRS